MINYFKNFKLKGIDWKLLVISFVAAVVLWNYMMNSKNPTRTVEYRDVSVQLVGAKDLYNSYHLAVVDGSDMTVNVKVSATSSKLADLTASQIKAKADLTESISSPGEYTIPYEVILPESSMSCVSSSPTGITVTVDKMDTKTVPVEVRTTGEPKDGYRVGTPKLKNSTVEISGPEQELETVANAVVTVDIRHLTHSLKEVSYDYTLLDENGDEIESENITREDTRVQVSAKVKKVKQVPLEVKLQPEEDADVLNASVSLSQDTVEIEGDPETVDEISSITAGTINVTKAESGDVFNFKIPVPTGCKLTDGQEKTVQAELNLDNITKKTVSVSDIVLTDSAADDEDGKTAKLITVSIKVEVEGREKVLESLKNSDVYVVAEIDSSKLEVGSHKVGVRVEVPDHVAVIGSYSAEVQIS